MLRDIPLVVRLHPERVEKADLDKELRIDKHNLNRELTDQPAKYAFWATLLGECSARAESLKERLEYLEAKLFAKYSKKYRRARDIKYYVECDEEYRALKKKLRHWRDAERQLKVAEKAFSHRKDVLMCVNANIRKEREEA